MTCSKRVLCLACAATLCWASYCVPTVHGQSHLDRNAGANHTAGGKPKGVAPPATKARMSLNLRDADIRDALSSLAMEFKTNVVLSEDVKGTITLHIFDATLEQAVSAIASAGGYWAEQTGNTTRIIKADPKSRNGSTDNGPVKMKILRLNFADLDQVKETLNALEGVRPIQVHEASKTIFVEDTPTNIKRVETIIDFLDAPPRQVLIEAKILEVKLTDEMAYGVDWQTLWGDINIAAGGFSNTALPDARFSSPIPSSGSGLFANVFTTISDNKIISLAIDALKTKTTVNTVATPKVMAVHGQLARVQVGGQQGYPVSTTSLGVVTETIEFINTGVILEITPFIDKHDNILLKVLPSINSATIEQGIPVVNSTSVSTTLVARSGQTIFMAGLIEDSQSKTRKQVPLLGDIPLVGRLFGNESTNKEKTETIVMLTPLLVTLDEPYTGPNQNQSQAPVQ